MAGQTPEVVTALAEDAETVKYSVDRFGYKIDGRDYRRVTTLLKGIPAPQLVGWAAKVVAETAARNQDWRTLSPLDAEKLLKGRPNTIRDERAQRGTNVHNAVEAYLKGGEAPKLNDDEENFRPLGLPRGAIQPPRLEDKQRGLSFARYPASRLPEGRLRISAAAPGFRVRVDSEKDTVGRAGREAQRRPPGSRRRYALSDPT